MPLGYACDVAISKFVSRGLWRRFYNIAEAVPRQGNVNHVTGDIHYLASCLRGSSTVLTVHDCISLRRLTGLKRIVLWYYWYYLPIRHARLTTVVSEATKADVVNRVRCDPAKIRIVPDCVSESFQKRQKPMPGKTPGILHIGTNPNKNLGRLATAIRGLNCRLTVVGSPTQKQLAELKGHGIDFTVRSRLSDAEMVQSVRRLRPCVIRVHV